MGVVVCESPSFSRRKREFPYLIERVCIVHESATSLVHDPVEFFSEPYESFSEEFLFVEFFQDLDFSVFWITGSKDGACAWYGVRCTTAFPENAVFDEKSLCEHILVVRQYLEYGGFGRMPHVSDREIKDREWRENDNNCTCQGWLWESVHIIGV